MTNDRSLTPVRTYRDFIAGQSVVERVRGFARDAAIRALSIGRSPDNGGQLVRDRVRRRYLLVVTGRFF